VCVLVLVCCSQALCPSLIRVFHGYVSNSTNTVELVLNGQTVVQNVFYGTGSHYFGVTPGIYEAVVLITGTEVEVANVNFTATPGTGYTIAVTGISTGPVGEVVFNQSPFVFITRVLQPNANSFVGTIFRLDESVTTRNVMITKPNYNSLVPYIPAKSATVYPDQVPGLVVFSVLTLLNTSVVNVANQTERFNLTALTGSVVDVFVYGDDSNLNTPVTVTAIQSTPTFDPTSGCPLVDGSGILTPISPVFSFTPCAASELAVGSLALLMTVIVLLF